VSQNILIILRFDAAKAADFEAGFAERILPLWADHHAAGRLIAASLTPADVGTETREGVREYILNVEVPGMGDHEAIDMDPRLLAFIAEVKEWQPSEPLVWFGTPRIRYP
jgi:hypothetical protein